MSTEETKPTIALADLDFELLLMAQERLRVSKEIVETHTANLLKSQAIVNEYLGKLCNLNSLDIANFDSYKLDPKTKIITLEPKK